MLPRAAADVLLGYPGCDIRDLIPAAAWYALLRMSRGIWPGIQPNVNLHFPAREQGEVYRLPDANEFQQGSRQRVYHMLIRHVSHTPWY